MKNRGTLYMKTLSPVRAGLLAITLVVLAQPTLSLAQADASATKAPPQGTTTAHDGQHDFDFAIGVWHTHIKRILDPFASSSESIEMNGTVTTRKVWNGKAELEEIEADGPKGHWEGLSLFLYNPSAHQWSQSFANSKVGTLTSNIGELKDGRVVLIGQDSTVNDKTILVRAVWSDIKPDSHKYVESYSNDGGATWVTSFVANKTRLNMTAPQASSNESSSKAQWAILPTILRSRNYQ